MFQVGQINIDNPIEEAKRLDGFIAGGVPDEGQRRTPAGEGIEDPRDKRGCSDERDGLYAEVCKAFQRIREIPGQERAAFIAVGDIAVLAVNASQGAAGKEDCAGAARTGDRRFFPVMRSDPGNDHFFAQTAKPRTDGTIRITLAGTERTAHDDTAFSIC